MKLMGFSFFAAVFAADSLGDLLTSLSEVMALLPGSDAC
jgi:hypothetical protein